MQNLSRTKMLVMANFSVIHWKKKKKSVKLTLNIFTLSKILKQWILTMK